MVVDLRRRTDHAAEQEDGEGGRFQIALAQHASLVVLPQQCKKQRRDHRIDIDAEDSARGSNIKKRLNEFAVEGVENIVVAALLHELRDEAFARVVVDGLALEHRVMDTRQGPRAALP